MVLDSVARRRPTLGDTLLPDALTETHKGTERGNLQDVKRTTEDYTM